MPELNYKKLDWVAVTLYLVLIVFGWMNIFSSSVKETGFLFQRWILLQVNAVPDLESPGCTAFRALYINTL